MSEKLIPVQTKEIYRRMIGKYNARLLHQKFCEKGFEMDFEQFKIVIDKVLPIFTNDLKKAVHNIASSSAFALKIHHDFAEYVENDKFFTEMEKDYENYKKQDKSE